MKIEMMGVNTIPLSSHRFLNVARVKAKNPPARSTSVHAVRMIGKSIPKPQPISTVAPSIRQQPRSGFVRAARGVKTAISNVKQKRQQNVRKNIAGRFKKAALMGCDGNCGRMMGCNGCPVNPSALDRMSADEIAYVLDENPELMGAALKNLIKKAKGKAQAVVKKVQAKIKAAPKPIRALAAIAAAPLAPMLAPKIAAAAVGKKVIAKTNVGKKIQAAVKNLPKPLKIAAGIALAPLAPTLAPALLTKKVVQAAAKPGAVKKAREKVQAAIKKMPKPLKIAAGIALAPLMPTTTAALLTTGAVAATTAAATAPVVLPKLLAAKAIKRKMEEKKAAQRKENIALVRPKEDQDEAAPPVSTVVPAAVARQVESGQPAAAAMQTTEPPAAESEAPKKSGMGALLPIAAAAAMIPFFL